MSTTGRPDLRSSSVRRRRASFLKPQRRLRAEQLEPRAMLAGDLPHAEPSEYWNYVRPTDINDDGRESTVDLLILINSLTQTGPRQLTPGPSSGSGGEGEGATIEKFYIDPNNDGMLNTLDLLMVVNEMSAEGEDPPIIVRYSFVPVAHGTNTPLTTIPEGGHYELRVMVQDTGVTSFMGDTRNLNEVGVASSFLDMFWDRTQTDVQVSETQTLVFSSAPVGGTFTLTFTDTDATTQTTGPISFVSDRDQTAVNIRNALVALGKIGSSAVGGLPNVEVAPSTANNRTFTVRFINDEANKNFINLSGIVAGGAATITPTETVAGDPLSLVSFQEMFRPRPVRDASFDIINDDVNDELYYEVFFGQGRPFSTPQGTNTIRNAGGDLDFFAIANGGPRPLTQDVEVFRLRMTAKESAGTGVVTFSGAYPQISSGLSVLVLGDATGGGPFSTALPAATVQYVSGNITIQELVVAADDVASLNEGTAAGNLNSVAIDVLGAPPPAAPLSGTDKDNTGAYDLVLVTTPTLPGGFQGSVTHRTAGQDGIPRPHFLYTVPNADFSGVVNFQYTIRDGVNAALTDIGNVTVTVNATNDAPVNSVPAGTQTVAEDAPAGLVFGGATAISISDVDAGAATVSINLVATNGTLTMFSLPPTLAINGDGTSNLTIVGSIADINPALSGLKYAPNLNYNGSAQITVTTNDNGNSGGAPLSDIDVIAINVTPTNDAPVNSVPAAVQVDESAQLSFTNGNTISVADIDVPTTNPNITVTLATNSTQGGTLNVTPTGGASVGGNNSQSVTVSGTLTAVNGTLATLKFNAGLPEIVNLTVTTSDNGNTGTPGPLNDIDIVEITVVATVRPRANPNTYNLSEGPTFFDLNSPSVLANDLPNTSTGAQVTLESVGNPSPDVGSVEIIDAGVIGDKRDDIIRFTPDSVHFFGQVSFTYSISETPFTPGLTILGPNATTTVTLNIANVADVPVAQNDGPYSATEDIVLNVSAALGVLANDTDADNLSPTAANAGLTAQLTAQPPAGEGSVNLASDGSFTWTPTAGANFFGTTSFKYRAVDPQTNQSNEATVTISVASVNDAPVAVNDGPGGIYVTDEDVPLIINLPGVLANDTDVETQGSLSAVFSNLSATNGVVSLSSDGSFVFTPNEHFNSDLGVASFRYRAFDNDPGGDPRLSNEATVTIQVNPVNDTPVAGNPEFTVEEGQILSRTAATGLRTAVTDVDQPGGFTGSIALVTGPAQGNLILNADGSFTYTPPAVVVNPFDVTFTYTASDAQATSNVGTVTIHVIPFNDPPVAVADGPFSTDEDTPLTVAAPGLLGNDTDEESPLAGLSAVLVSNVPAAAGSVVVNADGSFTYTPAADFFTQPKAVNTPISFSYQVSDGPAVSGGKLSNVITVTINVNEMNDNPVANPDLADPVIRNFQDQLLPSALTNDNRGVDALRVPLEVLSISAVGGSPTQATTTRGNTVRLEGNDLFYDDVLGILGLDTFEYTLSDGRGGTATATYTVNVVEFIPKDISGTVYVDADNDGVLDPGERTIAGVRVNLNGTNVLGLGTVVDSRTTDEFGRYSFDDLRPGNYTLSEVTPRFFRDGSEPASNPSSLVRSIADDLFTLRWDTPESIATGAITGLNFGERGLDASQLDDASGLISEILASSGSSGMVLAVGPGGTTYWSYCLTGWNTKATLQLEFGAGGSIPSLLLTIGGVTKRIYQDPSQNTGAGSPQSPPAGSTARFRIIGSTNAGDYIIRLDGTLSDFGFVASTGAPPEAGEGEYAPEMSDGDFRDSADQVFASEAWA